MSRSFSELPTVTPSDFRPIFLQPEIIGSAGTVRFFLGTSVGASSTWISTATNDDPFERQKAAFQAIPPIILVPYSGEWVVSRDGQIVDHDTDLQVLSNRFFTAHGDVDVFIIKVGQRRSSRIRTPFRRRS